VTSASASPKTLSFFAPNSSASLPYSSGLINLEQEAIMPVRTGDEHELRIGYMRRELLLLGGGEEPV
jgi:hypothetical protein